MLKYNKWLYSSILEATKCPRDVPFKINVTITWKHEWAIPTFMAQYDCARSHRPFCLTYWSRVTHICVNNLTIIGSDNGLSPGRRQAIIWTNAAILLIRNLVTNLSEILSKMHIFSSKKMHLKMSSAKWRQMYLGLNVLKWPPRPAQYLHQNLFIPRTQCCGCWFPGDKEPGQHQLWYWPNYTNPGYFTLAATDLKP